MASRYERLEVGPPPTDAKPGVVWRAVTGPGHSVSFQDAVRLAEEIDGDMCVHALQELEFGWVMVLQSRRYLETRDFRDQLAGHGITIVDRKTGDVFCSGSASRPWDAILGYLEASASRGA